VRIHALSTGRVRVTDAFLHARTGPTRQVRLILPSPFSEPLPIHVWVVEDDGRRILVDAGMTAGEHDISFARFEVTREEELPGALAGIGFEPGDIDLAVLTHLHGDHMNGAAHLQIPVLVQDRELAYARTPMARALGRLFKQPLPQGVRFQALALDDGPFGAFAAHKRLTERVVVVATPGHTPGHTSVICVDEDERHVLLAGDVADSLEQLRARRADAVAPKPRVHVATLDRVLAHGREHPTVFLPSHDPGSVGRLEARETL
jgi:glyoxylase-like metal-dependent hydrolase (beta-lactamase superfamily II)